MAVWSAHSTPPLLFLSNPIVELPRCRPCCRLHLDRRVHLPALALLSLTPLVEDDVSVRRLLLRLVLAEVAGEPSHDSAVVEAPQAGAEVAGIEPHEVFEHSFEHVERADGDQLLVKLRLIRASSGRGDTPPGSVGESSPRP